MSEKDLGNALLHGEAPIDLQELTRQVLRRDRRRVWFLGVACVLAWMFVVLLPWATLLPTLAHVVEHQVNMNRGDGSTATEQREQMMLVLQIVKKGAIATFLGSVSSMAVAAVCTVSLVVLSRRATLRQVNARLAEISAQLGRLTGELK